MTYQRRDHIEREQLAWKVRCLVARSYNRGRDRELLRRAGLDVPTEPGSWDAFDDKVFTTYMPGPNLRVLNGGQPPEPVSSDRIRGVRGHGTGGDDTAPHILDGGLGGNSARLERRPGPEASSPMAADGRKPPVLPSAEVPGQPTNFDREDH